MTGAVRTGLIDILLVEDSSTDTELILQAVREAGLRSHLFVVPDGEGAMAFLQHDWPYLRSPRPDLILLDLNLPGKDGRQVLADVKANEDLKRIPVVVLTASTEEEDMREAYANHANAYIQKPADLNELVKAVKLIETFWLSVGALRSR
jgi:two-component system, chemotaxis family, response regulator Rcp1